MDHTLVKELKDAGFPLGCKGCRVCLDGPAQTGQECLQTLDCTCHLPTLSELIEACGDRFVSLNKVVDPQGWSCEIENDDGVIDGETFGSTPEEVVARLWLILNKK